ncbi:MAG: alpha/beta hydrolase [Nitratireductor sp.]|nr:alpha/beta hydrolase [Nitratireductor sp.]
MPIARISDKLELAYLDKGEGETIVLVHGFASSKEANWVEPGWVRLLVEAGYRVVAFDNRGHGQSTKFHSSDAYSLGQMAADTLALMERLGIERPHVMGYSMGARISALLAMNHGERFGRVVLAGNGMSMIEGSGDWTPVRDALLAPSLSDVTDLRGRAFRKFADATKSDLRALAECVTAVREQFSADDFRRIANKVLIAIGTEDDIAGAGEPIAALIGDAEFLPIPGRDHMRAVGDKVYKQGVLDFLSA